LTEHGGRRDALFGSPIVGTDVANPITLGPGRRAVFSAPPRRRGAVVVECDRCLARRPVPLVTMAPRLVPSVWMPGRSHSRWMRCPTCGAFTWCRIHWRSLLG
jgi:hypothetical protein